MDTKTLIDGVLTDFCRDFVIHPYLCYTEHGLHALFYAQLYARIPEKERIALLNGEKVCVVQKEYPMAESLKEKLPKSKHKKSKRAHWDISILETKGRQAIPLDGKDSPYDYLKLNSVVEFGLNANEEHLDDDIQRLTKSTISNPYAVHFYRISKNFSRRDLRPKTGQKILSPNEVWELVKGTNVCVYYCLVEPQNNRRDGPWLITPDKEPRRL